MSIWLILSFTLLVLGVLGSFTPALPGCLFSGLGVLVYWLSTGYQQPAAWFVVVAVLLSGFGVLMDWFSGAVAARLGGASDKTSLASAASGILGFIFLGGPIGALLAVAGSVFVREYLVTGDFSKAKTAGIYSALGFLSSVFIQALISLTVLVGFILVLVF